MSLEDLADQFNLTPKKKSLEDNEVQDLVQLLQSEVNNLKSVSQYGTSSTGRTPMAELEHNIKGLARAVHLIGKAIAKQHGRTDVY